MMRRWTWGLLAVVLGVFAPSLAYADGVTVARGQFTDRVDHMRPVGDAASLAGARTAVYWLELHNDTGQPAQLTLVWSANGRERYRQSLTVLATRVMRTWAFLPLHHAHTVSVRVLDATGAVLHTDETTIPEGAAAPPAAASAAATPPAAH